MPRADQPVRMGVVGVGEVGGDDLEDLAAEDPQFAGVKLGGVPDQLHHRGVAVLCGELVDGAEDHPRLLRQHRALSQGVAQLNLFDALPPRANSQALMQVIDSINHSGLGSIGFAGKGMEQTWRMKREMLSPSYTTRYADLPVAR